MASCARLQDAWLKQERASHIPRLSQRLQVKQSIVTGQVVDALWHLCQQEAGLWGITNRSCSLFSSQASSGLLSCAQQQLACYEVLDCDKGQALAS